MSMKTLYTHNYQHVNYYKRSEHVITLLITIECKSVIKTKRGYNIWRVAVGNSIMIMLLSVQ